MMYFMLSTRPMTLLYALMCHIFCQMFSMKRNFRCVLDYCWLQNPFQDCGRPDCALSRQVASGRFHFRKYLSNQRQGNINFPVQSVNQGCLNLTSVPSAEQQWFNEIEAWKCRLKWGEMIRENIIFVCVQLNKLPGCKTGHSTAFPNIYFSCISQNWKRCQISFLPCLYFNGSRRSPNYSSTQTHRNQTAQPIDPPGRHPS